MPIGIFSAGACDDDDANQRSQDKLVNEAVEACRKAMIDLTVEAKAAVVNELHRWLTLEEASYDPAATTAVGGPDWVSPFSAWPPCGAMVSPSPVLAVAVRADRAAASPRAPSCLRSSSR
jgi:hypothetical protein